jgi:death-on-curing protein
VTEYLSLDDVLVMHERFATGVRDFGLIDAAVMRPQASAAGEDAYPSLADKASAMTESLARNHGFIDGNKRTALVCLVQFMMINGFELTTEGGDAGELVMVMLDIAEGRMSRVKIAEWISEAFEDFDDLAL